MPLRPPHEYTINRAKRTLENMRENPIRRFGSARQLLVGVAANGQKLYEPNPDYHPPILYQNGAFYLEDGTEVPKAKVPKYILRQLRTHPPTKPTIVSPRQITMTIEEAEAAFADPALDTRIQANAERVQARPRRRKRRTRRRPSAGKRMQATGELAAAAAAVEA